MPPSPPPPEHALNKAANNKAASERSAGPLMNMNVRQFGFGNMLWLYLVVFSVLVVCVGDLC